MGGDGAGCQVEGHGGLLGVEIEEDPERDHLPLAFGEGRDRAEEVIALGVIESVPGGVGATSAVRATSRRVRRHRETWWFRAVRTTHADGAGWRLTFGQLAHARAKASATASSAAARSVPEATSARRHGSLRAA